jgi:dihydroneopterin aldolase
MKHTVEVNGIKCYAFHGCLPEEEKIGGNYMVDVEIKTDFSASFETDDLIDTVDYVIINKIVAEEMVIRSKLIEHVGNRIIQRLKKEVKGIITAKIKVTKICPPIDGDVDNVAVTIEG